MQRQIGLFVFFLLAISFVRPVAALNPSSLNLQKSVQQQIQIKPCILTGTCPTNTPVPTQIPSNTPAPTSTPEPTAEPTLTPEPTVETAAETGEVLGDTAEASPSVSPQPTATATPEASPTAAPKADPVSVRELALIGGVVLLLLFIFLQNWKRIKGMLQKKPE